MKAYVPQYLHKPNKVFMIDMDEFMLLANGALLGAVMKSIFAFILGLILFFLYRRGKAKYPRGFSTTYSD